MPIFEGSHDETGVDDALFHVAGSEIIDRDLVEKLKSQTLIEAGYMREDEDGNILADYKQLQFASLKAMTTSHVVGSKKDLSARAVTKFELYAELLPLAPGVTALAKDVEARIAQEELTKLTWSYTNTGTSGFVQRNIGDTGLILCELKVSRTKINEETGKKEPTLESARFLTADRELIMTAFTGPAGQAFMRAARRLENLLGMVADRRPELAEPVARQVGSFVKTAVGAIPHADVKQVRALTSGTDGDGD